jgi:hypothetical protein
MVLLGEWAGRRITISEKANCLTISLESSDATEVYSYDYSGRPWAVMASKTSYRRGLNGKIVSKWQDPKGERARRWLGPEDARQIERTAQSTADGLLSALAHNQVELSASPSQRTLEALSSAAAFDEQQALEDTSAFERIYKPVGILPPDQYMAVVLQATEGCSFNTCTFCTFYRGHPFHIKSQPEFLAHTQAVKAYLGAGLSLRRTIFLGDANALVVPTGRLLSLLETVHQTFDVEALGGIYAFLDGFSGDKKSASDYQHMAELGVKRIYLGMESGNTGLLAFLNKPGKPQDVISAVETIKAGGISVGVIVLLGAGGRQYAHGHVTDSVDALNRMGLGMDDILYFSELIESEGMPYVQSAYAAHLDPLTPAERIAQGEEIERRLTFSPESGTPHISRYDIREFIY